MRDFTEQLRGVVPLHVVVSAVATVICVIATVIIITGGGGGGSYTGQAEFVNARGLLPQGVVRVQGARAGLINSMKLTSRNTVLVTFHLDNGIPHPRADATATVRPADLFGDIYMSLSLGHAAAALRGPIPMSATASVGRVDDLLRTFKPTERTGFRAMFVELALGLESRGVDLNRGIIQLRPAFQAVDRVMGELGSENTALRSVITNANRAAAQAASRNVDLGPLIDAFAKTVSTTAAHSPALQADLGGLPQTLTELRSTTDQLTATAVAAWPLATALATAAPGLSVASARLRPFLDQAASAVHNVTPTLRLARTFLRAGRRSFPALDTGLQSMRAAAPGANGLADTLAASSGPASTAFFVNIADEGQEPGNQPFDPFTNPLRHYWRGAAVLTCQTFGLPIRPGCLQNYLSETASSQSSGAADARVSRPAGQVHKPLAHALTTTPQTPAARGPSGPPDPLGSLRGALGNDLSKLLKLVAARPVLNSSQQLLRFLLAP